MESPTRANTKLVGYGRRPRYNRLRITALSPSARTCCVLRHCRISIRLPQDTAECYLGRRFLPAGGIIRLAYCAGRITPAFHDHSTQSVATGYECINEACGRIPAALGLNAKHTRGKSYPGKNICLPRFSRVCKRDATLSLRSVPAEESAFRKVTCARVAVQRRSNAFKVINFRVTIGQVGEW